MLKEITVPMKGYVIVKNFIPLSPIASGVSLRLIKLRSMFES